MHSWVLTCQHILLCSLPSGGTPAALASNTVLPHPDSAPSFIAHHPCAPSPPVQNFVVAGGSQNGTIAVITLPLSYVRGSPGQTTTLTLDAQNSSPRPGTTLTQWVWAVITIPDKRAVTNSTGRITQVRLRPGASRARLQSYMERWFE